MLAVGLGGTSAVKAEPMAIRPGETIEFDLRYLEGHGGSLTLVTDTDVLDGRPVWSSRLKLRTIGTLREFYSVEDQLTGYFDVERERSLGYDLRENHGGDRDSETVRYYHDEGYYVENDGPRRTLEPGALDLASALLVLRRRPLAGIRTLPLQVTGDTYRVRVIREGVELLDLNGFKTQAVRLRLRPEDPEAYEDMKSWLTEDAEGIYLWLSTDSRRIPLRIRASTEIGTVEAQLSDYHR